MRMATFKNAVHKDKRFLRVYMDASNKCNLKCRMCYFSLELGKEPPIIMDVELFEKIASEVFPHALSLNLSCAAEPLLAPNFGKFLQITKKYAVPETCIVTNGLLLNEEKITAMIRSGLTRIDVSIDGATEETYEKIRKGSNFCKVLNNIYLLQKLKKKAGAKKPYLYLDYALMRSTVNELIDFLHLAKKLGADSVRANHLIPFKGLNIMEESLVNHKNETNRVFDAARKVSEDFKLNVAIPPNFGLEKAGKEEVFNRPYCRVPFDSMYISSDGNVVPCIWFSMRKWCAGNFREQSFDDIWDSGVYEKLRRKFEEKEYTEYCRNCPVYGNEPLDNYIFKERLREDIVNISTATIG